MKIISQYKYNKYIFSQIIINKMSSRLIIPIKFLIIVISTLNICNIYENEYFLFLSFLFCCLYYGLTKLVVATFHLFGRQFKIIKNLQTNKSFNLKVKTRSKNSSSFSIFTLFISQLYLSQVWRLGGVFLFKSFSLS